MIPKVKRTKQWPDKYNGQLMFLDGKYWGLKMYRAAPGEYRIANVIVPDPDREEQGVLIKEDKV